MKSILEKGSKTHGCRSRSIVLINVPQLRISNLVSNVAHVALVASPLVIFELSELSICGFAPLCTCIGADFSVEARSGTGFAARGRVALPNGRSQKTDKRFDPIPERRTCSYPRIENASASSKRSILSR